MKCPQCSRGILSRNKKPDALGRIIERCDTCPHRRIVDGPETVPALSGSLTHSPHNGIAHIAPAAVVGQPCPCCHRKVHKLPVCVKCKKNRRVLGKSRCEDCSRPAQPRPIYCIACGTKFTPERGMAGSSRYRCPAHRRTKKPRSAA